MYINISMLTQVYYMHNIGQHITRWGIITVVDIIHWFEDRINT